MKYHLINVRDINKTPIEQVLYNRGVENAQHYLHTSDKDILNPELIDNMEAGAEMLLRHVRNNDNIMIQIDSDCDGYTSSAVLMNYLYKIFPNFVKEKIYYRLHEGKQHSIIYDTIPENIKLVVVPDAGSNDFEVHKQLYENGIDVLVIDHHEAEKVSEYACVINNQLCSYPTKSLSGVGMVYKFCCLLDKKLNVNYADNFLDLVALGLVADMMSLKDYETKHLIHKGLKNINNPFFKTMAEKNEYYLGNTVTPFGIAFYIAPYVNAITRSGEMEEKNLIFKSLLEFEAFRQVPSTKRSHASNETELLVEQACRTCVNVKNRQSKLRDSSLNHIVELIESQRLLDNKILCIILDEGYKNGLSGLIANQLMNTFQKPVLVLNKTKHGEEIWLEGSARGPVLEEIPNWREFYLESNLIELAQGHANAFGFAIKENNFDAFMQYCNNKLNSVDFEMQYDVDFIYSSNYLNTEFFELMNYSYLWGQELQAPLVVIENINITRDKINLLKGTTIKIQTKDIDLIKFKSNEQEFNDLAPEETGSTTINVIGTCEKNSYNGLPQIIIKDYEIVNKRKYYF